jgi:hypothetical protein
MMLRLARIGMVALVLSVTALTGSGKFFQTCETVTNCRSNADCFGGQCTLRGYCICPP